MAERSTGQEPQPILVAHLMPELLDSLVDLLSGLTSAEWDRPTACEGWTVKDVALHLLGVEIGNLSRRRDRFSPPERPAADRDLVAIVTDLNATWVQAGRRISPRLLCDLLRFTGAQVSAYFQSLDPYALGGAISWAGPEPAPVWLDIAREYTERWHHQQHIRDAVGKPGMKEPRLFAPVLDAFVRALPYTYRDVEAIEGTLVALTISGESGGRWFLRREGSRWHLYLDVAGEPDAGANLDQDLAWRLFTRGISRDQALTGMAVTGNQTLALRILDMVSIIA
jgi:uncharacterized protein (TIGR03083 family)